MTRLSQLPPAHREAAPRRRRGALAQAAGPRRPDPPGRRRPVDAGCPAGWRVHQKVVQIVREEIDAIGGQEMLMPVLNPAELWQRIGPLRRDRPSSSSSRTAGAPTWCWRMTHEEVVTTHVAQVVRSYRDLPLILYHFQIKERDEPRPRAGVLRTREFIMKDAYTFDRDAEGLRRRLRAALAGLRPDLRPRRARVVPGRVRRRDDGRHRRARVHGAVPGGRERRRAGARATPPTSRSRAPTPQPVELPRAARRAARRSRRPG